MDPECSTVVFLHILKELRSCTALFSSQNLDQTLPLIVTQGQTVSFKGSIFLKFGNSSFDNWSYKLLKMFCLSCTIWQYCHRYYASTLMTILQFKLTRYNMRQQKEIENVVLTEEPSGITEILSNRSIS